MSERPRPPLLAVAPPLPRAAAPASPRGPCRAGQTPTSCYPSASPSLSLALFPSRSDSPTPAVPVCGNPAPAPPRHSLAAVPLVELPERAEELPRRRRGPHLRRRGRGGRAGSTTTPTSSSPSRCSRTATRRCRRRLPSGGRPTQRLRILVAAAEAPQHRSAQRRLPSAQLSSSRSARRRLPSASQSWIRTPAGKDDGFFSPRAASHCFHIKDS